MIIDIDITEKQTEALSKTRGKDRQAIITDIQKIIKQYRGK